jgi:predicted O-methyltransferase YrrM/SAM-dependent methyltransferase
MLLSRLAQFNCLTLFNRSHQMNDTSSHPLAIEMRPYLADPLPWQTTFKPLQGKDFQFLCHHTLNGIQAFAGFQWFVWHGFGCDWFEEEPNMPTSPYSHLHLYIVYLDAIRPKSILDVGLGNGKLGFMARDYLDVMLGERYRKNEWKLHLDGIEVFGDYIQAHQKAIYDQIHVGDAYDIIDTLGTYDVVVLGDVLEHFEKEKGWRFLDKCFAHSNKALLLFVPLGKGWVQPAIYANAYETHRSCWGPDEIQPMSSHHELFQYGPGHYGAFLIPKSKYVEHRCQMLKQTPFFPQPADVPNNIRRRFNLTRDRIQSVDLNFLARHTVNAEYRGYFLDTQFKEHYRLLAYLSTLYKGQTIFDVGTLKGYSALALSYNPDNRVVSYDIEDLKELSHREELKTIEYRIGNVLEDSRLLKAPVILLDTYHDGTFEALFYNHLKKNRYKGLLVLDDIHLNAPMKKFWSQIGEPKEDVTDLAHWSGTGLVDFSIAPK